MHHFLNSENVSNQQTVACVFLRAVLVINKRNVTRKFGTGTQLWQILIYAKMWPIKEKENRQLLMSS